MYGIFGDESKRKINLGGVSSAVSHTTLIDRTRALRNERLAQQRRNEKALKIQAWWRGLKEARAARKEMRGAFEQDVTSLNGMRYLVIVGEKDAQALVIWSREMAAGGPATLFSFAKQPQFRYSWLTLVKQIALLLLRSVAAAPLSSDAVLHLSVLRMLLLPESSDASGSIIDITKYLLQRGFYEAIARFILSTPLESRQSPSIALVVPLVTLPFQIAEQTSTPLYKETFNALFRHIFTIPLLPNRISTTSLTHLSANVPFTHLSLLEVDDILRETNEPQKIDLLANLQLFIPPRYKHLDDLSITTYFRLLSSLLNAIPVFLINPSSSKRPAGSAKAAWVNDDLDSDSDSEGSTRTRVTIVSSFPSFDTLLMPQKSLPPPDSRTLKRISALPSAAHINTLLSLSSSSSSVPALISLFLALMAIWPTDVQTRIVAASPSLIREIYRTHVRGSGLGREGGSLLVMDSNSDAAWPAFLLVVELYTRAMLTMGDDEFFGTSSGAPYLGSTSRTLGAPALLGEGKEAPIARNPLSLDELIDWSRQLLHIAFSLFWGEDPRALQKLVGGGVRYTWEDVREKVTACLVAIHARDSRRPFVPEGHWLITSQIDVQSFVDAAIFEERELTSSPSSSRNQSKRQLAYLSPRLGVLNNIPFSIPFDVRVSIFRQFVFNDMRAHASSSERHSPFGRSHRTRISVRRGHVAEDGFDKLSDVDLKQPVEIVFIDQFGAEEAGIDGGGVFKEFFTSLCKEVFDTDRGLWLANKKNELYPNPHTYATESHSLNWYRFIGRILGKAMYEGILVDVAFAGFFLAKWLGRQSFLDDLASLDPDLYSGLIFLKHYKGNLEDLALNFTIAIDEFGETKSFDLIPGGSNIAVTRENRLQYIQIVSHYRLTKQIKRQSEAFFEGLSEMIDPKWIRMFNQQESQVLLGGVNAPIDFDDLRSHTNYGGLYDDNQETIVAFWKVVNTFDQQQRMALLRFVTSCSRPPLLGFKELVPNFSIRDSTADQHRLPTSSTCVNLLKLPRYTDEKVLRQKLLQAINSNAGFDLS